MFAVIANWFPMVFSPPTANSGEEQAVSLVERPVKVYILCRRCGVDESIRADGRRRRDESRPVSKVRGGLQRKSEARRVGDDKGY